MAVVVQKCIRGAHGVISVGSVLFSRHLKGIDTS